MKGLRPVFLLCLLSWKNELASILISSYHECMTNRTLKMLSMWDLRRNLPVIREGLSHGVRYVLFYRGRPVGELIPPSKAALELVFTESPKKSSGAERIRKNVDARRRKRLKGRK